MVHALELQGKVVWGCRRGGDGGGMELREQRFGIEIGVTGITKGRGGPR